MEIYISVFKAHQSETVCCESSYSWAPIYDSTRSEFNLSATAQQETAANEWGRITASLAVKHGWNAGLPFPCRVELGKWLCLSVPSLPTMDNRSTYRRADERIKWENSYVVLRTRTRPLESAQWMLVTNITNQKLYVNPALGIDMWTLADIIRT